MFPKKFLQTGLANSYFNKITRSFAGQSSFRTSRDKILDIQSILYKPKNKIYTDEDDRILLYYYKPEWHVKPFLYSKSIVPAFLMWQMIKWNPFMTTNPAMLPVMTGFFLYFLKKTMDQKIRLRHVVKEIYLSKDGEFIDVIYMNQAVRKWRQADINQQFFIPSIKPQEQTERSPWLKGDPFPQEWPFQNINWDWSWVKYYRDNSQLFYVPKNANYANMEVLTAAMNGKVIDTNKKYLIKLDRPIKSITHCGKKLPLVPV